MIIRKKAAFNATEMKAKLQSSIIDSVDSFSNAKVSSMKTDESTWLTDLLPPHINKPTSTEDFQCPGACLVEI